MAEAIVNKLVARGAPQDQLTPLLTYHSAALKEFARIYQDRFPQADLLGMGGSGVVLKLSGPLKKDELQTESSVAPKCLKYPHPCIGLPGDFSLTDVIDNEAQRLREINHPNVMPLEDTVCAELKNESVSSRDRRVPAYLMPFVRSAELGDFVSSTLATPEQMIGLLLEAADALSYLHSKELIHLDIKPANILVAQDGPGTTRALVSDFGFCKHIVQFSTGSTLVMGTDGYMDPDLILLMAQPTSSNENRVRDRVPRGHLTTQFDRYSFGATILDCIASFLDGRAPEGDLRTIPTSLWRGLVFVALRCSGRNPRAMRNHDRYPKRKTVAPDGLFQPEIADAFSYLTTGELKADLALLQEGRLGFLEPEVAEATGDSLCLPERMFAPLSNRVVKTIDSVLVRRLATISQLALCYHVYPGASHSRKEHVIGTYRTACRLLRQLILDPANPSGAMILKAPQQRLAMLAALLHDMSHIPLMHEFEDSLPELRQRTFTSQLLSGDWGGDSFMNELQDVLASWDVSLRDLRAVLGHREHDAQSNPSGKESREHWERHWDRPAFQLIRSIINGSVDADKIDYLQRDALHVGVRFGQGVDRERLETQITTVIEDQGSGHNLKVRCRMGTWRKGQAAAESLIGVRHSMYSQVYAHRTVRAARAMLNYVVWRWRLTSRYAGFDGDEVAKELFGFASGLGPIEKQRPLFEPGADELALAITPKITDNLPYNESRIIRWLAFISADDRAKSMAEALISRQLYKKVCSLDRNDAEPFIRTVFPRKGNVHQPSRLSARQWLSLIDHLTLQLQGFLSNDSSTVSASAFNAELPPLLLDIAIPKTMRTQSELSIVRDSLSSEVTWKRISRIDSERAGIVPGAIVDRSPIYEAYGGNFDDSMAPISIRLFARGDLAPNLRARIDRRTAANWLEIFRPPEEGERR